MLYIVVAHLPAARGSSERKVANVLTTNKLDRVLIAKVFLSLRVVLQSNYLVFMAELFWWFEVVKPSFVQPRVFDPNGTVQLHLHISMLLWSYHLILPSHTR